MAVSRSIPTLSVSLRASPVLAWALAGAHSIAAAALLLALPQWHWRALGLLALLVQGCWSVYRHALRLGAAAVCAFELHGEAQCTLRQRDGSSYPCYVLASSHVSTWLVVLHLAQPGRRLARYVVVVPDSVTPDRMRRLRVRLRWTDPQRDGAVAHDPSL